jgi:hypothetical protein
MTLINEIIHSLTEDGTKAKVNRHRKVLKLLKPVSVFVPAEEAKEGGGAHGVGVGA